MCTTLRLYKVGFGHSLEPFYRQRNHLRDMGNFPGPHTWGGRAQVLNLRQSSSEAGGYPLCRIAFMEGRASRRMCLEGGGHQGDMVAMEVGRKRGQATQ